MDLDNDMVLTSPGTTSGHDRDIRSQLLPPLPRLTDLTQQSSNTSDLPSLLPAHTVGLEGVIRASTRTGRNPSSTRSHSLVNWITSPNVSRPTALDQAIVVDGRESPRSDVISVDDNSDEDIVIESEEEAYIEVDDDSEVGSVNSHEGDDYDTEDGHSVTELVLTRTPTESENTNSSSSDAVNINRVHEGPADNSSIGLQSIQSSSALTVTAITTRSIETFTTSFASSRTSLPVSSEATASNIASRSVNEPSSSISLLIPNTSEPISTTFAEIPSASVPIPSALGLASRTIPSSLAQTTGTIVQISTNEANSSTSPSPLPLVSRVLERHNDSLSEFRSPKRKRIMSPEKQAAGGGSAAASNGQCEEEEEGDSCPICFEAWTTTGNHRLCSLKCGHLFGQSCIEKWLKGQGGKCPHCNAKAKRQDVRVLFAKTIKALDTSERDRALKDLEKERELRRKVEMESAQLRLQYKMSVEDTNKLRLELESLKAQIRRSGQPLAASNVAQVKIEPSTKNSQLSGQFVLEKTIKIWEGGNCRVMAYSRSLATLVVSQPSSSQLFPGFGIKKISALDFKTSQYLTIHSKPIRDMAFHQTVEDGILLSCGLDKKVKMTSLISNAVVQSYDTPMPAWSCAWNGVDCNYFYAGLQNGLVLQFDVRNTAEPVQELNKDGSRSPVASLVYVSEDQQSDFRPSGLLIGQLDRAAFLQNTHQGDRMHLLPLEGSLTSLHIEDETRHMLASYRPTARHPTIRHQLCELTCTNISTDPTVINNVCSCNIVHTFHGGRTQTVMSKTLIQRHPGDRNRLLVCGGDETNNSVHIWDSGTGQMTQRLLADGKVVDLCKFSINNQQYLGALTDKQCKVFKWR